MRKIEDPAPHLRGFGDIVSKLLSSASIRSFYTRKLADKLPNMSCSRNALADDLMEHLKFEVL